MRNKCIICGNTEYPKFKFPKEENVKKAWIESLRLETESIKNNSRVCAGHFKKDDFSQPAEAKMKIRRIKRNAVPVPSFENINFEWNKTPTSKKGDILQCFMCGSSTGRNFLRFPTESKIKMKWLENLNILNEFPLPTHDMFLCDVHFKNEDVVYNLETGEEEIKPDSVPVKIQHYPLGSDEEDCVPIEPEIPIIYISDDEENEKKKTTACDEYIHITKRGNKRKQKLKNKVRDLENLLDDLIQKGVVTQTGSRMINEVRQKYIMST